MDDQMRPRTGFRQSRVAFVISGLVLGYLVLMVPMVFFFGADAKQEIEGLRFSITSERMSYRYDQPIPVRLTLHNANDVRVHTLRTNIMEMYRFVVGLPDGRPAPLTLEGQRRMETIGVGERSRATLERGEALEDAIPMLNHLYDMTLLGEYSVTVHRRIWTADHEGWSSWELASNQVRIVVHGEPRRPEE